jgi:hypothetical protein
MMKQHGPIRLAVAASTIDAPGGPAMTDDGPMPDIGAGPRSLTRGARRLGGSDEPRDGER